MRRLAGLGLAVALLLAAVPATHAAPINDLEHRILDQVNVARVQRGLVRLRIDSRLWDLAGDRASRMAARNVLSHTVAGSLGASIRSRHIGYYGAGETIAYTVGSRSAAAAGRSSRCGGTARRTGRC